MSNELKPCPFCGGKTAEIETRNSGEDRHFAVVKCLKCREDQDFWLEICTNYFSTREAAKEAAIEAWNTRAERTCHPVEKFTEDSPWPVMVCSECRRPLHYDEHREMDYQPYCGCGAKVVE